MARPTANIACDKNAYGLRHRIKCFINKIKHCRRIAAPCEKTTCNFLSISVWPPLIVWLRETRLNVNHTLAIPIIFFIGDDPVKHRVIAQL